MSREKYVVPVLKHSLLTAPNLELAGVGVQGKVIKIHLAGDGDANTEI